MNFPPADLYPVPGIRLGVAKAGIRKANHPDLTIIEACDEASFATVFTQNAFAAAPVTVAKQHLGEAKPKYCLINTGYANAGIGLQGVNDALRCCDALADIAQSKTHTILPFSTGIIGERLPVDTLIAGLPEAFADLHEMHWGKAAEAIMTTDTRIKCASKQIQLDNETITITGIAKGAGMICPNMATMLGFVATDCPIDNTLLNALLAEVVDRSFNAISVDGETSTNDACVLIATGKANIATIKDSADTHYQQIAEALLAVFQTLAKAIVKDGEGATKFVTIEVNQGHHELECKQVGYSIAHSPLVKTALFASDPNWGRILAAVGNSGLTKLNLNELSIDINGLLVVEKGALAHNYTEAQGRAAMAPEDITITVNLARGQASATVWTTDFSHEYIKINAEYRT